MLTENIIERNTYSYRGFYVDALRAVDFVQERPEVDSSRIGVHGGSQGGALTLLVAALRQEVAAASAGAPYLAGVIDAIELTNTYPYREINDYLRLYPESYDAIAECWSYYDCINMAPLIQCPIIVNIGLNDNVVPPETGYAVFNAIGASDKKLYPYDGHGHDANGFGHNATIEEFFRQHLMKEGN